MSKIAVTVCPTRKDGEWLMVDLPDQHSTHIIPSADLIRHRLDTDCICGPFTDPVRYDNGRIGRIHQHHSLDGREIHEEGAA